MNPLVGLGQAWRWSVRKILGLWVRVTIKPDDAVAAIAARPRPVCYVLERESHTDFAVLNSVCAQQNLPRPTTALDDGRQARGSRLLRTAAAAEPVQQPQCGARAALPRAADRRGRGAPAVRRGSGAGGDFLGPRAAQGSQLVAPAVYRRLDLGRPLSQILERAVQRPQHPGVFRRAHAPARGHGGGLERAAQRAARAALVAHRSCARSAPRASVRICRTGAPWCCRS